MHTVNLHINELLSANEMLELRHELLTESYINNVELNRGMPHDMMVEYEPHHDVPMHVLEVLKGHGVHANIVSC